MMAGKLVRSVRLVTMNDKVIIEMSDRERMGEVSGETPGPKR